MKILLCFLVMFSFLSFPNNALAEGKVTLSDLEKVSSYSAEPYKNIEDIPESIINYLSRAKYLEEFIYITLSTIRKRSLSGMFISDKDLESYLIKMKSQKIQSNFNKVIIHDGNFDGKVSADEIKTSFETRGNLRHYDQDRIIKIEIEQIMQLDFNDDGVVSFKEASTINQSDIDIFKESRDYKQINDLLKLDTNGDGLLDITELRNIAKNSFATIDTNLDMTISKDEAEKLQKSKDNRRVDRKRKITVPDCKFNSLDIPNNIVVYGSGTYGGRKTGQQIDNSGDEARQVDIIVNNDKNPVALILGSYEPTIWNIKKTPNTEIHSVVVSGYHRQVIAGLDKKIPTIINHYKKPGSCKYSKLDESNLAILNPLSENLYKKPVEMFYPADKTLVVIGNRDYSPDKLVFSTDNTPESYFIKDSFAGKKGLEDAVKKGILRIATKQDANSWAYNKYEDKMIKNKLRSHDLPPVQGEGVNKGDKYRKAINPSTYNAYVVLKDFTYPSGLFGGNSASFFVPKGVSVPNGDRGHSSLYDFNKFECSKESKIKCLTK